METKSWCIEWFGSQGDFIAGKAAESVSLERFDGLESLYAVGPLEQARGEVSIYDSIPLISEVHDGRVNVTIDSCRHAAFLVYAIVENWRRVTVRNPIKTERQLEDHLLAWAVTSGIDVDQPFAFLLNGLIAQATFHILCNRDRGTYNAELHAKIQSSLSHRQRIGRSDRVLFAAPSRHFYPAGFQFPYARQNLG